MSRSTPALVLGVTAALAVFAPAHIRLIHPTNNAPLHWAAPGAVSITINATGSDSILDGSHLPALQLAIRAWNDATGTTATLVEDTSAFSRARTDWEADDIHSILFDEVDSSGYFPGGTGTVAVTPVWFNNSGVIVDADVLFNGVDFAFSTDSAGTDFDVQDVATHELGHLLGLDHSGWAGGTMYPYVDPAVTLHRSISDDDERGLRDAYPTGSFSTITGRVTRASDGTPVAGANVAAVDAQGRVRAGALAGPLGTYSLRGLPADTYTVWAGPLDQPVSALNLGAAYTVVTNFASTPISVVVAPGSGTTDAGDGDVFADTTIALGRNIDELPIRATPGEISIHSLHGSALVPGSVLTASDLDITVGVLSWNTTVVTFSLDIPAGEAAGHVNLIATNSFGEQSVCFGAIEIAPANPLVPLVTPGEGTISGGTTLTITGTGFNAGARVVLANQIYYDGEIGGCTVVDDTTISLTTRASVAGTWDVVVQDVTGAEGRASGGFRFAALPQVTSVFPGAGWAGGGTLVNLRGVDFVAGCTVRIDGALQNGVTFVDSTTLRFTSAPGVAGGPYVLEVETPDGDIGSSAFIYQTDPDPVITTVAPAYGAMAGGETITITGANFTSDAEVVFGADPDTGLGGTPAASMVLVDVNTLEVVTPPMAAGTVDVLVRLLLSDQADVAVNAFTFQAPSTGGGGGCAIAPYSREQSPLEDLFSFMPILLAFFWLATRARPQPVRVRARR